MSSDPDANKRPNGQTDTTSTSGGTSTDLEPGNTTGAKPVSDLEPGSTTGAKPVSDLEPGNTTGAKPVSESIADERPPAEPAPPKPPEPGTTKSSDAEADKPVAARAKAAAKRAGGGKEQAASSVKEKNVNEKNADAPAPKKKANPSEMVNQVRSRVARVVGLLCVLAALILALGVALVALRKNVTETNSIVKTVLHIADAIDGPFSREHGPFSAKTETMNALFNWGLGAIVYLVIGRVLSGLISPRS